MADLSYNCLFSCDQVQITYSEEVEDVCENETECGKIIIDETKVGSLFVSDHDEIILYIGQTIIWFDTILIPQQIAFVHENYRCVCRLVCRKYGSVDIYFDDGSEAEEFSRVVATLVFPAADERALAEIPSDMVNIDVAILERKEADNSQQLEDDKSTHDATEEESRQEDGFCDNSQNNSGMDLKEQKYIQDREDVGAEEQQSQIYDNNIYYNAEEDNGLQLENNNICTEEEEEQEQEEEEETTSNEDKLNTEIKAKNIDIDINNAYPKNDEQSPKRVYAMWELILQLPDLEPPPSYPAPLLLKSEAKQADKYKTMIMKKEKKEKEKAKTLKPKSKCKKNETSFSSETTEQESEIEYECAYISEPINVQLINHIEISKTSGKMDASFKHLTNPMRKYIAQRAIDNGEDLPNFNDVEFTNAKIIEYGIMEHADEIAKDTDPYVIDKTNSRIWTFDNDGVCYLWNEPLNAWELYTWEKSKQ